jgi:UDP-N-acetylglucosamine 1-carboxyvinyltransferase
MRSSGHWRRCCVKHARGDHLEAVIEKLRDAGAQIEVGSNFVRVKAQGR